MMKLFRDTTIFGLITLCFFVILLFINHAYGFHRDELAFIDNAKHLAWGYVEYPPLTPYIASIVLSIVGPTLFGIRFVAALIIGIIMMLTGLIARELGGQLKIQLISAFAGVTAPLVLFHAAFFSYDTFDYLWWVLIVFMLIKLLKTDNPRWWLGIGTVIGLGLLTKYTILALVAGIAVGVILTPSQRYLKSPWFWGSIGIAVVIFVPNLLWQIQHHLIAFDFIKSIHTRDVSLGRTHDFLVQQLYVNTNVMAIFFYCSGLYFYLFSSSGKKYRLIGWMFLTTFILLFFVKSRFYYPAPLYPMLIAAGIVLLAKKISPFINNLLYISLVITGILMIRIILPTVPVNSSWWNFSLKINNELAEEIGWPDLVKTVADIRSTLPPLEAAHLGIITSNYGEAGAIDLYGPSYGLPPAISGVNSYWLRGYPNPPPQTLILIGFTPKQAAAKFSNCKLVGHITNSFKIMNEETKYHPDIFVCHQPVQPWPEFWKAIQSFG